MKRKLITMLFLVCIVFLSVGGTWINQKVISRSQRLYEGISVVLDAGHGGKDKGAQYGAIYESEINLGIVYALKSLLEELGMKVILTRQDENDLATSKQKFRKNEDLKNRMKIINQKEVDFYISIHMNAFANEQVKGSQIFYKNGNEDAYLFATHIQNAIQHFTNSKLKVKTGNYYILKHSDKIGILLECGFLSNEIDRAHFSEKLYQERFAREVREGIVSFLKEVYE